MKVLFVGLGGIGQRHVRNLRLLLGTDVEILAYRVRGLTQVLTEDFQIEPAVSLKNKYQIREFDDLDKALSEQPDAMFVGNPSDAHINVALAGAKAGCHLFIEKPLSSNEENVAELIKIVDEKNLVALVGFQLRFHPALKQMQALLEQNIVGQVLSVQTEVGEFLPGFHPYEDYRELYASRADLGGGVVLSQIHELDYLYWLFGFPRRVFAMGGQLSNLEVDVEDVAISLLEFEIDGKRLPVELHQDYVQRPPSRSCKVIGDNGKIFLDLVDKTLTLHLNGRLEASTRFEFERNQLFIDELKHFLACIDGQEKPVVTLRDGWQSLRMALAIKRSLATGDVVKLDEHN
jgi:predicted dehydrogenase